MQTGETYRVAVRRFMVGFVGAAWARALALGA
jgi:hypothetical protein